MGISHSSGGHICLFLLQKYRAMELLGRRVDVCLIYVEETAQLRPSGELSRCGGC